MDHIDKLWPIKAVMGPWVMLCYSFFLILPKGICSHFKGFCICTPEAIFLSFSVFVIFLIRFDIRVILASHKELRFALF